MPFRWWGETRTITENNMKTRRKEKSLCWYLNVVVAVKQHRATEMTRLIFKQ